MLGLPKRLSSKKLLMAALLVAFVFISIPNISSALTAGTTDAPKDSWFSCFTKPVTCSIYFTTLSVNAVMNLIIALGAMLVRGTLAFSMVVLDLKAVQDGFSYSLGVANLGFVLGIIIIALATILRSQTYGIKQILWKLVVAAIVVNFGLVIMGVILNFSNTLTNSFLKPMGGAGGFTDQLVNALGTAKFETKPLPENAVGPVTIAQCNTKRNECQIDVPAGKSFDDWKKKCDADFEACRVTAEAAAKANAADNEADSLLVDLDRFMKAVLGLVFAIIFKFIIAFTLLALAILLLIRFVYISVLAVLLPLAWLMWVFPKFSHLSGKWWNNFLRWAFFPPIVVFFLRLAIVAKSGFPSTTSSNIPEASLGIMINNPSFISSVAESLLAIALAIGGLFAANSFGIHGSSVAMGAMKGAGAGFMNWAQKAPGRAGRAGARAVTREKPTQPLMPKYEQPRGVFQKLANVAHRGEKGIRDTAFKYGPVGLAKGAAEKRLGREVPPEGGAPPAVAGGGVPTPGTPPKPPGGAGGPAPVPLGEVSGAGAATAKPSPTEEAEMYERFAAGTPGAQKPPLTSAKLPPAPMLEQQVEEAKRRGVSEPEIKAELRNMGLSESEIKAKMAGGVVAPGPAGAAPEAQPPKQPETPPQKVAWSRNISEGSKTQAIPTKVKSLRERLDDYGKGKDFWSGPGPWEPLKKAFFGKDTLMSSVWNGMKKGSGLSIFKDGERKKEDTERERRLIERVTAEAIKKGMTPAQAAKLADKKLERYQEKRLAQQEQLRGIMLEMNESLKKFGEPGTKVAEETATEAVRQVGKPKKEAVEEAEEETQTT